jgi:stringent starvation protein B
MEYVKNNEIVLNVGFEATSGLKLGNEFIEFRARFGGVSRDIVVPVDHVVAIYARENGQGMAFPVPTDTRAVPAEPRPPIRRAHAQRGAGARLRLATTEARAFSRRPARATRSATARSRSVPRSSASSSARSDPRIRKGPKPA